MAGARADGRRAAATRAPGGFTADRFAATWRGVHGHRNAFGRCGVGGSSPCGDLAHPLAGETVLSRNRRSGTAARPVGTPGSARGPGVAGPRIKASQAEAQQDRPRPYQPTYEPIEA